MKIKDLFHGFVVGGIVSSPINIILNEFNSKIINIDLSDNPIVIHLKKDMSSNEAISHLFINDKYKSKKKEIFDWFLENNEIIIGITLGQLKELEINLENIE